MAHVLLSAAVAVTAGLLALVGRAVGTAPSAAIPASPFGGSAPVHLTHVGHIEVDLRDGSSASGLARVRCAGVSGAGTACFVSR